jgi:hypothetical protein
MNVMHGKMVNEIQDVVDFIIWKKLDREYIVQSYFKKDKNYE